MPSDSKQGLAFESDYSDDDVMSLREHPDFARVWAGLAVSNVGDGVNRIAVLWWARQATGSDAIVVLVALATVVPSLAAAPLAG